MNIGQVFTPQVVRGIRNVVLNAAEDIYIGFSDYLFANKDGLDAVIAGFHTAIQAEGMLKAARSLQERDPAVTRLYENYRVRVTKMDDEKFQKVMELAFLESAFALINASVPILGTAHYDIKQMCQTAAIGLVYEYTVQAKVGLNEERLFLYAQDTLTKALRYVGGDKTMGADYSDFQCVAVPKLAKMVRALFLEEMLRQIASSR